MPPDSPESPPSPALKSRTGLRHLADATRYSLAGLSAAWRHETAFRQEVVLAAILVPVALWLARDLRDLLLLLGSLVLVLVVELLNSAVEAVADAVSTDRNPLLGRAKDLGSSAVMLSLILAGAAWATVLLGA